MKIEIFVEVQAVKPHPAGGETYDTEAETTWKLQDCVQSDDKEILVGFLLGLAEEVNPLKQIHGRPAITMHTNWKIVVIGASQRGNPPEVIAELITKRNGVAGSMLRGTARSLDPNIDVKKTTLRGMDDD